MKKLLLILIVIGSKSSFAATLSNVEIRNQNIYDKAFTFLPMTEAVSDTLSSLDYNKVYKCEARQGQAIGQGSLPLTIPLYILKNCVEVK